MVSTTISILVLSKFAYEYTSFLHCYSLYSYIMSSTNDVCVAPGESAEAKRAGAKERELLKQPNNGKSG